MAEDRKSGLAAALDAVELGDPPEDGADQLEMLPGPLAPAALPGGAARPRGPGRPPGARNKRTDAWVEYLQGLGYRSPLVVLAETFSRPVEDLAKALVCTKLEAFRLQLEAAEKLAPYLHQKQPVAVQLDGMPAMQLVVVTGDALGEAAGEAGQVVIQGRIVDPPELDGAAVEDATKSDT